MEREREKGGSERDGRTGERGRREGSERERQEERGETEIV